MAKIPDSVKTFLDKPNVAVLATISPAGRPQATPIWFMLDNGHILVNTAKGRIKLRNMEANPRVVLAIVDHANPYQYVQIRGTVCALTMRAARGTSTACACATPGSRFRIRGRMAPTAG